MILTTATAYIVCKFTSGSTQAQENGDQRPASLTEYYSWSSSSSQGPKVHVGVGCDHCGVRLLFLSLLNDYLKIGENALWLCYYEKLLLLYLKLIVTLSFPRCLKLLGYVQITPGVNKEVLHFSVTFSQIYNLSIRLLD